MVKFAATVVVAAMTVCLPAAARAQTPANAPSPPTVARDSGTDVALGIGMMRDSDKHGFVGARATLALNVTQEFAVIAEGAWLIAAAERVSSGRVIRDAEQTAMGGIRVRRFVDELAVPYLQITAGYSGRFDNGLGERRSLFASRAEVGLDFALNQYFGLRAGGGWTYLFANEPYRSQFGGTIALTLSLGQR